MKGLKSVLILFSVTLAVMVGHGQTTGAVDTYTGDFESSPTVDPHIAAKIQAMGREQQEQFRNRISIQDAVGDDVPLATARRLAAEPSRVESPDVWLNDNRTLFLAFVAVALMVGFLGRKFLVDLLKALNAGFNPWMAASDATSKLPVTVRAEEKGLAEFLAALKAGPWVADGSNFNDAGSADSTVRALVIKTFYEKVPSKLGNLRQMAREIRRTSDEGARQKILAALRWELHSIRSESGVPELLPVWQLAFATEGLLKQLSESVVNVTPSALRTLKGSLELLEDISRPGIEPDLLTRKQLQMLAVDDDPISCRAVSCALERALNKPEIAEDCEAALALATAKAYDVIFLDVQMPKMDGFELCSKIHETSTNRNTPIVFVTCHSDFETRAKSSLVSGADLIGKPFLTFEITVKALTVVLRSRMRVLENPVTAPNPLFSAPESGDNAESSGAFLETTANAEENLEARQLANQFLADTSDRLLPLREAFQDLFRATDAVAQRDLLGDIYVYIHSFIPHKDLPTDHPAEQLRAALEGLLRKLIQKPSDTIDSTLFTLVTAVQLLDELCQCNAISDRVVDPPFRMLVVDDDPVSRRTITSALQMVFGKPEDAESGEAALTLAGHQSFDVIFLDAQMPIMDGFETYDRIRQSNTNDATPVVFVASHGDGKSLARAHASGASDFIEKPFLNSEIILKALTVALRNRLGKVTIDQVRMVVA